MGFLDPMRNNDINKDLLNISSNKDILNRFTTLQNDIGVSFETKIIGVTSIKNDPMAAAFAKAFADTYAHNGTRALIVDANMYNPSLEGLVGQADVEVVDGETKEEYKIQELSENVSMICLKKEIYPSEVYKTGIVQKIIEEYKEQFDHIIVLVPAIKEHKEVVLLKDVLNAIILVAQKNVTRKESIYNALVYFQKEGLPIAKTVILK